MTVLIFSFIALWGLDKDGQFVFSDKIKLTMGCIRSSHYRNNIGDVVLFELAEARRKVSVELEELGFAKLSNREKVKRLLYLFQCDLLPGLSGQILSSKSSRDSKVKSSVSLPMKLLGYGTVLLVNAGMLFYIFLFALQQSKTRQSAWLQSFLVWLLCEVCFVSTIVVLVLHYFIPNMIRDDVGKIGEKLKETLSEYHRNLAKSENNNNCERQAFNSADFFFVSTRLARLFPDLPVAKAISHFRTPFPRRSYQHVNDALNAYKNSGMTFFFRSFGIVFIFMLGNYINLPQGLQDSIIHSIAALGIGYTVILHTQLFSIFPALAFLPLFVVCALGHFYLKSRPQATVEKHLKGKVQPISHDESYEGEWRINKTSENLLIMSKATGEYIGNKPIGDGESSISDSWNDSEKHNDWMSDDMMRSSKPSSGNSESFVDISVNSSQLIDLNSDPGYNS